MRRRLIPPLALLLMGQGGLPRAHCDFSAGVAGLGEAERLAARPIASLGEGRALGEALAAAVEERAIRPEELDTADEVFATGNYAKVQPCTGINGRALPIGPITTKARELYWSWMRSQPRVVSEARAAE